MSLSDHVFLKLVGAIVKIKCVMFDFGFVLGIFNTRKWNQFICKHRTNCIEPKELFGGSLAHILNDYDLGRINDTDFFNKVCEAYKFVAMDKRYFFHIFGSVLELDLEMLKIVQKLKARGLLTVLITNMDPFHAEYIRSNYSEVMSAFDHKMISCEEGVTKPNSEAWIRPLDHMGLKVEECIFIDDHYPNIQAAQKLGIMSWYYNVTDINFRLNESLESERKKFNDFLTLLGNLGYLYSK